MLNKEASIIIFALLILLVVTGWYAASLTRLPSIENSALAKGVLEQISVVQTSTNGSLQYIGNIEQATESSTGDMNFTGFKINYYDANDAVPWVLSADNATLTNENSEIDMAGQINLSRHASASMPSLLIQTEKAVIRPQVGQVSGNGLITFTEPGTVNTVSATGFLADLKNKKLNLFSQVKSKDEI